MSRNCLEDKDFECWFLYQSLIVRMSVSLRNVKYASKTQNEKFKLKPNTNILTCVVDVFLNYWKWHWTRKMLRLQFNFALPHVSSNLHIVWQYVAWLLPISVKSQDESSQQVDGLEMRTLQSCKGIILTWSYFSVGVNNSYSSSCCSVK